MGIRRLGLVLGFLGVAGGAMASFDLMLLPGSDGRIYRYDPVNNVQLGSYASGPANPMVAANTQGRSYCLTTSSGAMRVINYSTGESLGLITVGVGTRAVELHGGNLWTLNGSQFRRYNPATGGPPTTINLDANISWRTMARSGDSMIMIGVNSSNVISYQTVSMTTLTPTTLVTTSTAIIAGSSIGKAAVGVNAITGQGILGFTFVSVTGLRFGYSILNNQGLIGTTSIGTLTLGTAGGYAFTDVMPAAVAGHSGFFVYGQDFTTPDTVARVTQYDMYTVPVITATNSFAAPGGGWDSELNGFHPANVVAPEPGTILALSAGVGVLLRRRRGKAGA